MSRKLKLTDETWVYGSYPRRDYKYNCLYTLYQYKDFSALYNLSTHRFLIMDGLMQQMFQDKLISVETKKEYAREIYRFMESADRFDDGPMESIYGGIHRIRKIFAGTEALEKERILKMKRGCQFEPGEGIDQSRKKEALMHEKQAVILALCQPELISLMQQDLETALKHGKQVYLLVSSRRGNILPPREVFERQLENIGHVRFLSVEDQNLGLNMSGISWDEQLQSCIDEEDACLLVYGEEGLLHCKHLQIDSVVCAEPSCFYTKAVTNQLGSSHPCVVYVPKHFDITAQVGLIEKTRISYWQLARLWEAYGDDIYTCSPKKLYQKYPQYFINVYESGADCPEAAEGYPIQIRWPEADQKDPVGEAWLGTFYEQREQAIREYLNSNENLTYVSTYFNESLEETEIPWDSKEQQDGILVHGICTRKAEGSRVIFCPQNEGLHQLIEKCSGKAGNPDLRIFSNFLFFMTPRLSLLYNELRKDRTREQCAFNRDHLDHMCYWKDGKRIETFPLYRKACIAMKKDGKFLFFNYRLGGGRMAAGGHWISWTEKDVDVWESGKCQKDAPIRVYTPYYSKPDESRAAVDYQKLVGADRLNVVIMQDRIICVRMGEVMLSSVGVIVSLNRQYGEAFVEKAGLKPVEDGYYECDGLEMVLKLDPPDMISQKDWEQIEWAYGGGMSLILNGKGVCDEGQPEHWFREEGWMSPLSRQTQEAEVHKMVKHPRTAIGLTRSGDLVILIFSGRTFLSAGADYDEMCQIARKLFPDIWYMMNVDGGGSAMIGIAIGSSFMELSYPAVSLDSCAGMVRPINTVLCLKQ